MIAGATGALATADMPHRMQCAQHSSAVAGCGACEPVPEPSLWQIMAAESNEAWPGPGYVSPLSKA